MPITFWLFNNTGGTVTIVAGEKEINIDAGRYSESTGLDYHFSIISKHNQFRYMPQDIPLSHVHWVGWGPFAKRIIYTQLEVDGKMWILNGKTQNAATEFIAQPEGFPLVPNM